MLEIIYKIWMTLLPFVFVASVGAITAEKAIYEKIANVFICMQAVATLALTTVFVWGYI